MAFAPFWEAWQVVDAVFYAREKIDHTRMIKGAIEGMLATLGDKYTFYQEPEKAKQTSDDMQGKTVGIGIYLRITDGKAYVWKPIAEAPAIKAGVQHDDQIIAVDTVQIAPLIAGKSVDEAAVAIAALVRGKAGTQVTLILQRGTAPAFPITITRTEFVLPSVEWQTLDGNIAYIHISEFKSNTPKFWRKGCVHLLTLNRGVTSLIYAIIGAVYSIVPKECWGCFMMVRRSMSNVPPVCAKNSIPLRRRQRYPCLRGG